MTAPVAKLHIETDTTNTGDNTAYLIAPNIGPNPSRIHFGASGDWYIRSADGSGKVILQDTGGDVGIGTPSPSDRLQVAGNIRVGTGTTGCVRDKALPAGEYTIEPVEFGGSPALRIQSRDGRITAVVRASLNRAKESQAEPKLIFNRFGEQYFMSQVLGFEEKAVYILSKWRTEEALAISGSAPKRQAVWVTGRHQSK